MTPNAFRDHVFVFRDEMYRFAKRLLASGDEAQDIVQDLMLKFWKNKEELQNFGNLRSYVMTSVKNECMNRLKHESVRLNYINLNSGETHFYSEEMNNLKDEILKFIAELPEKQKLVIHLKDVEDYSVEEISEILAMEQNAVRTNLARAREKIKTKINTLMQYEQRQFSG